MKYRVHRFDIDLAKDQIKLEQFLNGLGGEIITIIPNVNPKFTPGGMGAKVDFLLIIEKIWASDTHPEFFPNWGHH